MSWAETSQKTDSNQNLPLPQLDITPQETESQVLLPQTKTEKTYFLEDVKTPLLNDTFHYLDQFQGWVGAYIDDFGESADDFFGTEESFDRTRGSRVDVMTPIRIHASGQIDTEVKFRAKIELPKTNKKWNLMVTSANDSIDSMMGQGDNNQAIVANNNVTDQQGSTAVGFRFMLDAADYTSSFFDFGLNFRNIIEPDPYVRIKGNYKWQLSERLFSRMTQDLFWESYQGVGLASRQTFDYQANQDFLLRSETSGTWWDKDQYYELAHTFYLYEKVNIHRGVAYNLGWNWDTKEVGPHLTAYHTGMNLRERVYKKWLYVEIEPRIDFSQDTDFKEADPSITLMLEMQFYDQQKN